MSTAYGKRGTAVLMIAHVAGMVDLVALPIWVGTLMQHYGYSPQRAGVTVTLFLLSVVASSLVFAPLFNRLPRRPTAAAGFFVAALAFAVAAWQPVGPSWFVPLAVLHVFAGLGVGCGLSFTHGCIGRSANPHRLFALAGAMLGLVAVFFLGGLPQVIQAWGAATVFGTFAALMAFGGICVSAAFPDVAPSVEGAASGARHERRIPKAAWLAILVIICMTLNQTMVFAFLERIGISRGFTVGRVNGVLLSVGLVNLCPGVLAALLQRRLQATHVALVAPVLQAGLAFVITSSESFLPYALSSGVYIAIVIFTHTFLFGLVARLDTSGRAVAATPAMMMVGSGIAPGLGGAVVEASGYAGIGWTVAAFALLAVGSMTAVIRELSRAPVMAAGAHAARARNLPA